MASSVRLDDLDVVPACQPTVDDHRVPRRHGRRERVDDEEDPHDREPYRTAVAP
jgi:hypothetical protein